MKGSGRVVCDACGGNNLRDNSEGQEECCAACGDGDGTVPCETCDGDGTVECDRCGGSCERECEDCGGEGEVLASVGCQQGRIDPLAVECGDCYGSGTVACKCDSGKMPCEDC